MPKRQIDGAITQTGPTAGASFQGPFNFTLHGSFQATIRVERRFFESTEWHPCTSGGGFVDFTAPLSEVLFEPENGVEYRLNCLSFTSGTVNWRLSQ